MPKISILVLLLELFTGGQLGSIVDPLTSVYNNIDSYLFKNLLLFSSLLSLIIGTVVGLAQKELKRLLAYSTISHIGFILLALAINTEHSVESFIFYIIQYSITNLDIFFIVLSLGILIKNKDINYISELQKIYQILPILSLSFCICLFSMAGVPPFIGFFSKQFVLYSAVQNGYYFMSFIAIITSIISASYYLKIIKTIFENSLPDLNTAHSENIHSKILSSTNSLNKQENVIQTISHLQSFIISVLTLSIIFFIIKPSMLLNSVHLLSLSLFIF